MAKKSNKKRPADPNAAAFQIVQEAVFDASQPVKQKNPAAVALGRLGGLKGGKARAKKLTPEQRKKIARKAAMARWKAHRN